MTDQELDELATRLEAEEKTRFGTRAAILLIWCALVGTIMAIVGAGIGYTAGRKQDKTIEYYFPTSKYDVGQGYNLVVADDNTCWRIERVR